MKFIMRVRKSILVSVLHAIEVILNILFCEIINVHY